MARISVIGGGSYGTSLAILLAHSGHELTLWCYEPELVEAIGRTRENHLYLPGYPVPDSVHVTGDIAEAARGQDIVIGVTPSRVIRAVLGQVVAHLADDTLVVNASKGLEDGSLARVDEMYADLLPERVSARSAYLSGPTFAKELAQGLPAALVVASRDAAVASHLQQTLSTERFRLYTSDDVVGVLIGGALKNVVAIAAGTSDGLGYGLNTRAALITRGLAEITRIGVHLGAKPLTFAGLSGMGDLVLTCSGDLSRNRQVGLALGQGRTLAEITADMRMVAEGVGTTKVAHALTSKLGVRAPIIEFMYEVLYRQRPARDAISQLMARSLKPETD